MLEGEHMGERWQGSPRTLMVVEDDPKLLASFVHALERMLDAVVAGASSIAEARQVLHTLRPDACIVDFQLPDGSGVELIQELRAQLPHTRIALITGYGSMEVGADAVRAGADRVMAKPVTVSEIMSRLYGSPQASRPTETPTADRAMWEHMQRVLADCGGNRSLAARKLRIDRGTLQRWLDRAAPRH